MTDTALAAAAAQIDATSAARALVRSFFDEATFTATHVVYDPAAGRAAVIDSVLDFDPASGRTATRSADAVIAFLRETGLQLDWLLETHAHADHLSAAAYIQKQCGGRIAIGEHIAAVQQVFGRIFNLGGEFARDGGQFDHLFKDGEGFAIGGVPAIALHVPGHTPADLAYVIGDAVFAGDTLFMPDYGTARADFPGGDAAQLFRSIRRLLALPGQARLFLCHDYKAPGRDDYVWETTIAAERVGNIHVHDGVSEAAFTAMRTARDAKLDMPRLLLPSVQVNIRAGHFPPAETNGVSYLKLPLNML
ncbi:MBL fold metallo-hydrolase [Acidocella sp. KAb 2-4]|uniref:MBL fold metallo-hydrolase n=1 Tax=Acidocella sp. KAb 2-4 TaxID=2885158 RepID=UPI001D087917|nr:MBL fold metallo-hydrolase [Acidocella sp. KAb 2-4]MCB5944029.1 MBL fold metallo-hydrolase [Acidocella sp. KAb 2-4]